jgi:methyl-accepting chemotaxis protein
MIRLPSINTVFEKLASRTSIKIKILALITTIGLILSLLLAWYVPNQAKRLGTDILKNDAEYLTNLLSENLSLGLQTMSIDDGASLKNTLNLLKSRNDGRGGAVSDIRIFDRRGVFITGLNEESGAVSPAAAVAKMSMTEQKESIRILTPLKDMDLKQIGTLQVDFSKKVLNQKIAKITLSTGTISILVLFATLFLGFLISREVTGGIRNAVDVMQVITRGEGDLTQRIEIGSKDEIGQLQGWINRFMEKMHDLVSQVKWNSDLVTHAATAISTTSTQMADGAEKQAERAIEAATTVDRITASIGQNARHAVETTKMAEEATLIAREGTEAMQSVLLGMKRIVESTQDIGKLIYSLSRRTEQIGEVIHLIDDIAVQTNLLAINASIEATRAGNEGKGFMVIANEIHRLSDQSMQSTQMIVETVKSIQKDIFKATQSMKETENTVAQGQSSTQKTEEVLDRIVHTIRSSMEMMKNIASSFTEQSAGVREVSSCVDDISQITRQASSGAVAVSLASKEMKLQTEALHEAVNHFKLKEGRYGYHK